MSDQHVQQLLTRYLQGECSAKEKYMVEQWYAKLAERPSAPYSELNLAQSYERILAMVLAKKKADEKRRRDVKLLRKIYTYAAILLLVAIGGITYKNLHNSLSQPQRNKELLQQILPGSSKATLTLEDGSAVELSDSQSIVKSSKDIKYADGSSIFEGRKEPQQSVANSKLVRLNTPKGGFYSVILDDGTKVWLNAESELRYPRTFEGNREVYLFGEGYFEVAKKLSKDGHKLPFSVITERQKIEVLGTIFNVKAYDKDNYEKTSLVEGAVTVIPKKDISQKMVLTPGRATYVSNKIATISTDDIFASTAWKRGRFSFDNKSFRDIMSEIERWYDIDLEYPEGIPEIEFIGGAYRNEKLDVLLNVLKSAQIKYSLRVNEKGRRILTIINRKEAHLIK
jgi:Fe2+-dicitrate sensor, membrane component